MLMGQFSEEETKNYKSRSDFLLAHGHQAIMFLQVKGNGGSAAVVSRETNALWQKVVNTSGLSQSLWEGENESQLLQEVRNLSPEHRTKHHLVLKSSDFAEASFVQATLFLINHEEDDATWSREVALLLNDSYEKEKYAVSGDHLHDALKHSHILAVSVNQRGEITYANQSMEHALEEKETELLGRNLFDEFTPLRGNKLDMGSFLELADRQDIRENLKRSIKTKSGKLIKLNLTSIIYHEERENLRGLTILAENITEQKEVKRDLQKKNKQLAELFKTAYDLIQIFTENGDLLFVNQSWKEKLGYQNDTWSRLNFYDIIDPHYLHETLVYLDKLKQGQVSSSKFKTVLLNRQGQRVYVAGSVNARQTGKETVEYRGIFHDISEQVRAERAQNLYNSIANLAIHSPDLETLFASMHRELKKVLPAENFYVALLDEDEQLQFPYRSASGLWQDDAERETAEGSLAGYVLSQKQAVLYQQEEVRKLADEGSILHFAEYPSIWLGVPLQSKGRPIGLLSVQHDESAEAINQRDLELLDFVSGQVALAVERKVNEEKLNEQTARLNAIFESSTHLIWSVDMDYRFTSFNKNFLHLAESKYSVPPVLGHLLNESHEQPSHSYFKDWRKSYELAAGGFPSAFEMKFDHDDVDDNWYQVFINPVYMEDGSIREISGIAHDITVRKRSELKLLESEEKFRNIYESFQDIYFRCRLDGTITLVSPSVKELTDYETYEVLGKNITNYYLYDKRTKNLIRQLVKNKRVRNFEASVIKANGDLMQSICNVRLIYNLDRRPVEIEGTIRDITKLKKTTHDLQRAKEMAENSLKVKEGFLANMSHEIRTPMNGIISMIDMLADTQLNHEQADYVETVRKSSETLLHILNDILDLSKIEAGKMKLHPVVVSLASVLEKEHALFYQQARQKKITFSYAIAPSLPAYFKMDETRFLQVLSNLCSNALKFTPEGGKVHVQVSDISEQARQKLKPKQKMLKVMVSDTGIGISTESQDSLFQNFSQVDSSITKSYGGTGLGLSISKQLSEMMGGSIGVESEEGKGSTFWFTCRVVVAPKPETKQEDTTDVDSVLQDYKPHVLLVDDNLVNQKVTSQILKKNHCSVEVAVSGPEAIALVQEHQYDIILMDIQMPEMDGVAATRAIRELGLKNLPPIIAMTAYSMQGDREKFLDAGLDDYVSKPIRPQLLINKLAGILQKKQDKATASTEDPDAASEEVIDFKVLGELEKYGGKELIAETLNDFQQEARQLINSCSESLNVEDYDDILAKLHTLKGNASTLGISRMARLAKEIEADLKQGQKVGFHDQLAELQEAFFEFEQAFKKFLNTT